MIPFIVGAMLMQTVHVNPPAPPIAVPFGVGETIVYSGKYIVFSPGDVIMKVASIDTVRGVPSWHFTLSMDMNIAMFKNKTDLGSWTGIGDFISRRFTKKLDEKDLKKNDDFRIFPDSGFYRNNDDTTHFATPRDPLDDLAFIYYLRTAHFVSGKTDTLQRYFRKKVNPVVIQVLGHDIVEIGGVRRNCWLIHPIVDEPNGMFSRGRDSRIWITDDGLRLPVQISAKYGPRLTLTMSKYTPGH